MVLGHAVLSIQAMGTKEPYYLDIQIFQKYQQNLKNSRNNTADSHINI